MSIKLVVKQEWCERELILRHGLSNPQPSENIPRVLAAMQRRVQEWCAIHPDAGEGQDEDGPAVLDIKTRDDIFGHINGRLSHNQRVQLACASGPGLLHKLLLNLASENLLAFTNFDDRMTRDEYRAGLLNMAAAAIAAIEIDVKQEKRRVEEAKEEAAEFDQFEEVPDGPASTAGMDSVDRAILGGIHAGLEKEKAAKLVEESQVDLEDVVKLATTKEEDDAQTKGLKGEATCTVD